jgi:hypothetical protein
VYYNFIIIEGSNYIINSSISSLYNYLANIVSTKDLSTLNTNSNSSSNKKDKKKKNKSKSNDKDK